jgi:hypothetical protein
MSVITDYDQTLLLDRPTSAGAVLLDGGNLYSQPLQPIPAKKSRGERLKEFFLGTEQRTIATLFALVLLIGVPLGLAFPVGDSSYPEPWRTVSSVIGYIYSMAWNIRLVCMA